MRKVLGLLTEDFRLYHDLVAALKARDLPFVSLSFARRIPDTVGAVLTSPAEAGRVRSRHIVAVDDIDSSIAKAIQILKGKSFWSELLVGIDPGREPGVAMVGDGEVIDTRIAASPEAVAFHVRQAIRTFPATEIRVRIGHGDPTNRNRILNALARDRLRVEIVDEAGTTHRTPQPDVDAPRERRARHDFVRVGGGGRARRLLPRGSDCPSAANPAAVKALGRTGSPIPSGA